jgi:hypothetical protein
MRNKSLLWLSLAILCGGALLSPVAALADHSFLFASVVDGKRILMTRDSFVERMSPFDRAARMKTDREVSENEYLAFAATAVLEWDDGERQQVQSALRQIEAALTRLVPDAGKAITIIKTTGDEEADAAYTRGDAIILPRSMLSLPEQRLSRLLAHEFFHILSRRQPKLRVLLHEAIGFQHCGEVELPLALRARRITNPDAPVSDYCIQVGVAGTPMWAIPILYARAPKYDPARGGNFLGYVSFALMMVERSGAGGNARPLLQADAPKLVGLAEVSNFFEQVGRNTQYIIHPEEILADNFALLVLGEWSVPSPDVLRKISDALAEARG